MLRSADIFEKAGKAVGVSPELLRTKSATNDAISDGRRLVACALALLWGKDDERILAALGCNKEFIKQALELRGQNDAAGESFRTKLSSVVGEKLAKHYVNTATTEEPKKSTTSVNALDVIYIAAKVQFGISDKGDIPTNRQSKNVIEAKQAIILVGTQLLKLSLDAIAKRLGVEMKEARLLLKAGQHDYYKRGSDEFIRRVNSISGVRLPDFELHKA